MTSNARPRAPRGWLAGLMLLAWLIGAIPMARAATITPYVPAHDDIVLQRVPAVSDPRVRRFETLRRRVQQRPGNRALALELARAYIDYARSTGNARYLGRALATLEPWLGDNPVAVDVQIVQATVLQSRHQFTAARRELVQALARAPDNAQGWLTLATVDMVQGRMDAARSDCVHTANTGGRYLAIVCNGALLSQTGRADQAYRLLSLIDAGGHQIPPDVQAYVDGLMAEAAARSGRDEAAEQHYRRALQFAPGDNFLLADYSDFLLDHDRPADVIALVEPYSQSDTLFLRQVLAEAALGHGNADADIRTMADRFAAMARRNSHVYRREQARFVLKLEHDPQRALRLAQQNWTTQRAPKDVQIFLEAALAAGQPTAAARIIDFLDRTNLRDPDIDPLARRVRQSLSEDNNAAATR